MTGSETRLAPRGAHLRRLMAPAHAGKLLLAMTALVVAGCGSSTGNDASAQKTAALEEKVNALEARLQVTEDTQAIEKLTRAYGYYVDKAQWDDIVELFADESRVEIAGRGVYRGKKGAATIFKAVMGRGKNGLNDGALFNHMILQGVVNVDPGGQTAKGRWRAFIQIGTYKQFGMWAEGTYENLYVKENGVWKFKDLHYFATYYTPYDQGWAKAAMPNNGPSKEFPPDEPQSIQYDVFPGHYIPAFHYPNPVTGKKWEAPPAAPAAAPAEEKK